MEPETLALTLPIRRLVEFLLRTGSIDSRFTGFDRALEGARLHRKLQRAAVKEFPDYQAEVSLRQQRSCAGVCYTLEGRADGIFTDTDPAPEPPVSSRGRFSERFGTVPEQRYPESFSDPRPCGCPWDLRTWDSAAPTL